MLPTSRSWSPLTAARLLSSCSVTFRSNCTFRNLTRAVFSTCDGQIYTDMQWQVAGTPPSSGACASARSSARPPARASPGSGSRSGSASTSGSGPIRGELGAALHQSQLTWSRSASRLARSPRSRARCSLCLAASATSCLRSCSWVRSRRYCTVLCCTVLYCTDLGPQPPVLPHHGELVPQPGAHHALARGLVPPRLLLPAPLRHPGHHPPHPPLRPRQLPLHVRPAVEVWATFHDIFTIF